MPGWVVYGILVPIGFSYLIVAGIFCLILAAELLWPRERAEIRWNAVIFTIFFLPTSVTIVFAMRAAGLSGFTPILTLSGASLVLAGLLIGDFLAYWFHRAQHAIPALWRLHSVHHSVEKFGPLTGYQHIAEVPIAFIFYTMPLAILTGGRAVFIVSFLTGLYVNYLHSTTSLNLGRLAGVFCDNRAHRIHHSVEPRHHDRNFGMMTLIWDRMFGTVYFPNPDEWPKIGLDHMREPQTLRDFVMAPFRKSVDSVDVEEAAGRPIG